MKLRTHFFQKEALQNALVGFFIELANIFMGKKELMTAPTLSRKEELFEQFLQLLFEHCKEQHVVTFYAEKLFITPQYLSLILKAKSRSYSVSAINRTMYSIVLSNSMS